MKLTKKNIELILRGSISSISPSRRAPPTRYLLLDTVKNWALGGTQLGAFGTAVTSFSNIR